MSGDSTLRDLLGAPLEEDDREKRWGLVAMQLRAVARIALRGLPLAPDDVEDLVQEVILRFIDSSSLRGTASEVHSPNLYLARTLRNAGLDLLRRRERQQRLRDLRDPAVMSDAVERLHNELEMGRLAAILRDLPPKDQELIRLRFWEDATLQEIAELHGISISTAAYRLMRILAGIRRQLNRSEPNAAKFF